MLIILSPSKTLDFSKPNALPAIGDPEFIKESIKLTRQLNKFKPAELEKLMHISPKLAYENANRFSDWHYPYKEGIAKPAFAAFKGEVYEGLKGWELEPEAMEYANSHVRILSGLYGVLKPGSRMLPYRLEMGTALSGKNFDNLYEFWGSKITNHIKEAIKQSGSKTLVNLASVEYAKAVDFKALKTRIITPMFKEFRNGEYKFITFSAKRARGLMTRFAIDRRIKSVEDLKLFDRENYQYMEQLSDENNWLFVK
ncbi:MAG: peroxide stress protein YaaA [Lentimicrobiaceae bacterium]|jgi:hypothetical protein|nr:peroxide stress protein YaaA [Lentimicrobiaceae bacterium]MDD4596984.1 peroxide stress protein YaaA [Lentimicrobiaceae bacterium]MDY0026904.1 peroxide stress protein YaaA [Lentimicrobium sp.]